jgi:hypothetical protein
LIKNKQPEGITENKWGQSKTLTPFILSISVDISAECSLQQRHGPCVGIAAECSVQQRHSPCVGIAAECSMQQLHTALPWA